MEDNTFGAYNVLKLGGADGAAVDHARQIRRSELSGERVGAMESRFGWTLLSRDALRRAEMQLRDETEGVRDEVGFLAVHQAYADRFFPGTSVLHTRLRYALFVPWLYQEIAKHPDRQRVAKLVEAREIALAGRLNGAGEAGVIGGLRFPEPTTQPPTMVYWTALIKWGILRPLADRSFPSRQAVHRAIAKRSTHQHLQDDDKQLLVEESALFCSLPPPPKAWGDSAQLLDFRLPEGERRFLKNCFTSITRPEDDGVPSLLARLVEGGVNITETTELWSRTVQEVADEADSDALTRARQAAALAAIGRGVYSALVEEMRERVDGLPTDDIHRSNLI